MEHSRKNPELVRRAVVLFLNFFLIILAYYQVKSASRSIYLEYWGADLLPQVWIISALTLGSIIGVYHHLVETYSRLRVVLGSCLTFIALLVVFWVLLGFGNAYAAAAFYVFVDIFSVILVEQFWSLTNTVSSTREGKSSYWFIGTGGLLGGGAGGALSAFLVAKTTMSTNDLLLACAALLATVFLLNLSISKMGLYQEYASSRSPVSPKGGWKVLIKNRYLLLIASVLFCSQIAQPIVEYQWAKTIESTYTDLDLRTQFYGSFFFALSLVSIGVNLIITPVIHRYLGVMAGMLTQPLLLAAFSTVFIAVPTLLVSSMMKISDRGLSYSINRASKELLYIPIDPVRTYQAKAWIDMLGYRLFKVLGSTLILAVIGWFPAEDVLTYLSVSTLVCCALWVILIGFLSREYSQFGTVAARA